MRTWICVCVLVGHDVVFQVNRKVLAKFRVVPLHLHEAPVVLPGVVVELTPNPLDGATLWYLRSSFISLKVMISRTWSGLIASMESTAKSWTSSLENQYHRSDKANRGKVHDYLGMGCFALVTPFLDAFLRRNNLLANQKCSSHTVACVESRVEHSTVRDKFWFSAVACVESCVEHSTVSDKFDFPLDYSGKTWFFG
jgi:hypothetical protein